VFVVVFEELFLRNFVKQKLLYGGAQQPLEKTGLPVRGLITGTDPAVLQQGIIHTSQ
jgi:hypothetical protein